MLGKGGFAKRRQPNAEMRLMMSPGLTDCTAPPNSLPIEGSGTVIRFRPRPQAPRHCKAIRNWRASDDLPVDDIDSFEYPPDSDADYRNRMWVNFVAAVVIVVLMIVGDLVINAIVAAQQTQYCHTLDAAHCVPSYIPISQHN
jgi:hypothetical protein